MNNETVYTSVMITPQAADPRAIEPQIAEWEAEFEAALRRPLQLRMHYSFIRTYKPVLDDTPYRSFETMAEYREWCEKNLPSWLGYGRSL